MGARGCQGRNRSVIAAFAHTDLKFDALLKTAFVEPRAFWTGFIGRVCLFLPCSRFHSANQLSFLPTTYTGGKTVSTRESKAPCFLPVHSSSLRRN